MYSGIDVTLAINPMNAPNYKRADQMAADIRIGGIRFLDEDYTTDFGLSKNTLNLLRGSLTSRQTASEADLEIWMRGAGYAMRNVESSTTCNWDGSECYFARVLPHIDSISESTGSMEGGQEMTIEGNGFKGAKNVEVMVADVPCDVKEISDSAIKCVTGAKPALDPVQAYYPGENGLYRIWANQALSADTYLSNPTNRTLLTSAEIAPEYPGTTRWSMI